MNIVKIQWFVLNVKIGHIAGMVECVRFFSFIFIFAAAAAACFVWRVFFCASPPRLNSHNGNCKQNRKKHKYSTDPQIVSVRAQRKSDFQFRFSHFAVLFCDGLLRNLFDKLIAIHFVRSLLWMGIDHFALCARNLYITQPNVCAPIRTRHFVLIHLPIVWSFEWMCAFVRILWWVRNRSFSGCMMSACVLISVGSNSLARKVVM